MPPGEGAVSTNDLQDRKQNFSNDDSPLSVFFTDKHRKGINDPDISNLIRCPPVLVGVLHLRALQAINGMDTGN